MKMNMVERVVIAIRDSFNSNDIDCYPIAKAAIAAMSEPTKEMSQAGSVHLTQDINNVIITRNLYQAMIDEALK